MSELLIRYLTTGWLSAGLGLGCLSILGASFYDFKQLRLVKQRRSPAQKRVKRPLISVVVWTSNNEASIEDCLTSVIKSSKRKYELVVVDNASGDASRARIRAFMAANPKKPIKLVAKRRVDQLSDALPKLLKKSVAGELILVIGADCRLAKQTLSQVAAKASTGAAVTHPYIQVLPSPTIVSLIERFDGVAAQTWQKAGSFTNRLSAAGLPAIYDQAPANLAMAAKQAAYAGNIVIYRQSSGSYKSLLAASDQRSWLVKSLALSLPLAVGYFSYLAAAAHYTYPLALSWAAFSFWLILAAWSDEHRALAEKLKLTLLAPVMFGLFNLLAATLLLVQIYKLERHLFRALSVGLWRRLLKACRFFKPQTRQA